MTYSSNVKDAGLRVLDKVRGSYMATNEILLLFAFSFQFIFHFWFFKINFRYDYSIMIKPLQIKYYSRHIDILPYLLTCNFHNNNKRNIYTG